MASMPFMTPIIAFMGTTIAPRPGGARSPSSRVVLGGRRAVAEFASYDEFMRRAANIILVAAFGLAVAASPRISRAAVASQAALPGTDDFPSLDANARSLVQRGLLAKTIDQAAQEAPHDRATIELLLGQLISRDALEHADVVLDALRRFAAGDPDEVEYAAQIVARHDRDILRGESPERRADFERIVAAIRARVHDLPREQAARTARQLIWVENRLAGRSSSGARPMVRAFVKEYAGTQEALLAQIEIIRYTRDVDEEITQLDAFARAHAGTAGGAAALYAKAGAISQDRRGRRADPPQTDPTERFMRVLGIVEELESGRWPPSQHVRTAARLVIDFFVSDRDEFEPGNLERMLETYLDFTIDHASVLDEVPNAGGLGTALYRIGTLSERLGNRVAGIEAAYDALAATIEDIEPLLYRKVGFYIGEVRDADVNDPGREPLIRKAFVTLATLSRSPNDTYARKARATIASLHFYLGNYESAIDAYRSYLSESPESDWAWVATLRIGQAQEAMGDWESAVATYRDAARDFPSPAPAAVLANTLAARASESLHRFDRALDHYGAAAAAWDDDFGPRYSIAPSALITHADLTNRIADLAASARFPEGTLLEGGRRLLNEERWREAHSLLEALINAHPTSPLVHEARYLANRSQLERAFEIADVESAQSDEPKASEHLAALSQKPWDPAVGAAGLAVAAILGKAGYADRAWSLTRETLNEWRAHQAGYYARIAPATANDESLRSDVAAIRNILFQPLGGEIYEHERARWNAFDWPDVMPSFLIVNPDMPVKLANGRTLQVLVPQALPELDNVLFMTGEHLRFLYSILGRLGGTETRPPRAIMETPNQPIGASVEILALWKEFFPARPGHWGGWVLGSYPAIGQIEFLDEKPTRAKVGVTIGYSGCTVHLEKREGNWAVVRLSSFWIT